VRKGLESNVGEVYLMAEMGGVAQPQWLSYLNVFDGFHSYKVLNSSLMSRTYSFFTTSMSIGFPEELSWDEALNDISLNVPIPVEQKALFFTVVPGNNETGAARVRGGGPISFVDRQGGETYAQFWQAAISSNATDVLITSWNEWHEGTELEPSRQYGFSYVTFTRHWTAEYKQKSMTSGGMPIIRAKLSPPVARQLPGVFDTNLTLTNSGDAPAFCTNVTVTSGQNLSMSDFVYRNFTVYSETESSNLYSAIIPLIMPNESVTVGISYRLASGEGVFDVATRAFNATGNTTGTVESQWDLSKSSTVHQSFPVSSPMLVGVGMAIVAVAAVAYLQAKRRRRLPSQLRQNEK
jgi:hypothetical protein